MFSWSVTECSLSLSLPLPLSLYLFFLSLSLSLSQGTNASALEKDIGPEQFPINEHYFGLVNVSIYALCIGVGSTPSFQQMTISFID